MEEDEDMEIPSPMPPAEMTPEPPAMPAPKKPSAKKAARPKAKAKAKPKPKRRAKAARKASKKKPKKAARKTARRAHGVDGLTWRRRLAGAFRPWGGTGRIRQHGRRSHEPALDTQRLTGRELAIGHER